MLFPSTTDSIIPIGNMSKDILPVEVIEIISEVRNGKVANLAIPFGIPSPSRRYYE